MCLSLDPYDVERLEQLYHFTSRTVRGGGKKGKSQGNEDSANANDMCQWMKPQIGFCTIGKCDPLSYFISIESLPAACKSHPLFLFSFRNMELFK
jgi:hypothetical protein